MRPARSRRLLAAGLALTLPLAGLAASSPFSCVPSAAAARQAPAAPTKAAWTVLCFMDADNDLEAPQLENLRQMAAVGSTEDVRIVALVDRSDKSEPEGQFTDEDLLNVLDWEGAKLLTVEKGRFHVLEDLGDVNMGDPALLKSFALKAAKRFPAERYALVFGDHGASWPGFNHDGSHEDDSITLRELSGALKAVTASLGGRLDLVHFDDCLMGNLEVATALAPYARYMTGSEELVPGAGTDYEPILEALNEDPDMDGAALGKTVVSRFADFYLKSEDEDVRDEGIGITMSCVDLSAVPALAKAAHGMGVATAAEIRKGGRASWLKVASARRASEEYGKSSNDEAGSSVFDLMTFARQLGKAFPGSEVATAAAAVQIAGKAAVLHSIHGKGRPKATGLSVFVPDDAETLEGGDEGNGYAATSFAAGAPSGAGWLRFAQGYCGVEGSDDEAPKLSDAAIADDDLGKNETTTVTCTVKGDDVSESFFVLAKHLGGEKYRLLGTLPAEPDDAGELSEEWDGGWFYVTDGNNAAVCPIVEVEDIEDDEDAFLALVPMQVQLPGQRAWTDVTAHFYIDTSGDEIVGAFVYAFQEKKGQRRQVNLPKGAKLRPVYPVHDDATGEQTEEPSSDPTDVLTVADAEELFVATAEVEAGKYVVGFSAEDYAGNSSESFVEVTIE